MKALIDNFMTDITSKKLKTDSMSYSRSDDYKKIVWETFKINFSLTQGKSFIENEQILKKIKPIFYYFIRDKDFFECDNIFVQENKPSFDRGLLLIGGYGCGKSSIMKAFEKTLPIRFPTRFKFYSSKEVVQLFEQCITPDDKKEYYRQMQTGQVLFDDLGSERLASNYGKVNLMEEILENRCNNRKLTHATMNFSDEYPGDVKMALKKLGDFYGPRSYDRFFELFNIVVFEGKSMRR